MREVQAESKRGRISKVMQVWNGMRVRTSERKINKLWNLGQSSLVSTISDILPTMR